MIVRAKRKSFLYRSLSAEAELTHVQFDKSGICGTHATSLCLLKGKMMSTHSLAEYWYIDDGDGTSSVLLYDLDRDPDGKLRE